MIAPHTPTLEIRQRVRKPRGYAFPGIILAIFSTTSGETRYVVEADHPEFAGMLHIFNAEQLEPRDTVVAPL